MAKIVCSTSVFTVGTQCHKHLMAGRNVDRITVDICIQQLGRVEEIIWLPYDAGLSAAAETLVRNP